MTKIILDEQNFEKNIYMRGSYQCSVDIDDHMCQSCWGCVIYNNKKSSYLNEKKLAWSRFILALWYVKNEIMGNHLYEECQWPKRLLKELLFVKGCVNVMIDWGYSPSSLFTHFSGFFESIILRLSNQEVLKDRVKLKICPQG